MVRVSLPDTDRVTQLIRQIAAEEILPRFRRLSDADRWEKRPGSWVTVADTAAEERLTSGLTEIVGGSRVIGEEAAEGDPSILDWLNDGGSVWIVDPVDGTANFAAGRERFAVIVAFVQDGETKCGWIHDPIRDLTVAARAGEGATIGSQRQTVAARAQHRDMTISLGARLRRDKKLCGNFAQVTDTACCGMDYFALATGNVHAAHYRNLKPWDHAAGHLIHREAGGHAACLDGTPYRPGQPADGGMLLAPDAQSWQTLARLIREALDALR